MRPSERPLLLSLFSFLLFVAPLPPAFGACTPDVNADNKVNAVDAWILYLTYSTSVEKIGIGRGEVPGGEGSPKMSIAPETPTVAEGSPAVFVLTASKTSPAISVEVRLSATGAFGVSAGTRTVEFEAGATTATLSVDTRGDDSAETWGTVTAMIECGDGYLIGTPDMASVAVADDDVTMSIAAETSTVVEGAPAVFVLTASEAPKTAFGVEVALSATGAFEVAGGTRTVEFEAGATTATLNVDPQGDDANDDGVDDDANDDGVVDDGVVDDGGVGDGGVGDGIADASGTVTATLQTGFGYAVGAPSMVVVAIADDNQE